MNRKLVPIKGMHCHSCELLVEDELLKIPGVCKAVVNQNKGEAEVFYDGIINDSQIEDGVVAAGYTIGAEHKPWISRNVSDYKELLFCFLLLFNLFFIAQSLGLLDINTNQSGNYYNLSFVFLIGITAGVSTCMALVGGLVLGASARFAEKHPRASALEKFKPHLFFNLGRIASYFVLGGLIGYLGSFFQMSTSLLGFLIVGVGFVMLLLGLQLIDISPALKGFNFSLPKSISKALKINKHKEKEYSHANSALMGAFTFFLPCGFTQAMQLFAMSSGSPSTGALVMGVFALGTAPGLLGIGGLTSIVKGTFARLFFKTAGLVVIGLAVFNISNGYNLTGVSLANAFQSSSGKTPDPTQIATQDGFQMVQMTQSASGYRPNKFTVKKGVPVRWIINSTNSQTCASSIVSDRLGIRAALQPGENIVEFTPKEVGTYRFTCIMGMYSGSFTVVDDSESEKIPQNNSPAPTDINKPTTPTPTSTISSKKGEVQVLRATYTVNDDIQPKTFTARSGKPVRLEILAKEDGLGCMGSVSIPGLTTRIELFTAGQTTTFEFVPEEPGTYPITCSMGVPRAQIIIN